MTRATLRGTWGCPLLPLDDADQIDYTRLAKSLDYLVDSGLDGIYAHGSAGEFHTLEEDEFNRINDMVAERSRAAGLRFQLGASHMSGQVSVRRIARAATLRPDAIQVILPDWVALTTSEAVAAVSKMAERAGDVPLVLYNPPQAKTSLTPAQFGQLAAHVPQLIGIKVAGGDQRWYAEMRQTGDLAIFVAGHRLATGISQGAAGAYSNVACLAPRSSARWYRMIREDHSQALLVEARLQHFLTEHIAPWQRRGYANAALDKLLAHLGGWSDIGTRTRWPHQWIQRDDADRLRAITKAEIGDLLDDVGR